LLGHIYISLNYWVPQVRFTTTLAHSMSEAHLPRFLIAVVVALLSHGFALPSVQVFIVLSGYCLMLPVAQAAGTLKGGLSVFVRRRAIRILPPYFAMLTIAVRSSGS
jgi:peptidoglycan/LPS O-acetylase OafA/YrhL